ncbi:hypothetical protein JCM11641_002986 [Rhodosporidiobolus odoratus]
MPSRWNHLSGRKRNADDDEDEDDGALTNVQADDLVKPPGIEPFGPSPPFHYLSGLYEKFESATRNKHKKPGHKGELLAAFFDTWRKTVGPDLYPLVRLLIPDRDTRRKTYNLKEAKLAKGIIAALDLPPKGDTALKLTNWKTPTKEDPGAGEFATVAFEVIRTRSTVKGPQAETTIDFVNRVLDELSHSSGSIGPGGKKRGLQTEHNRIIRECITRLTAEEMKWLIRIILRDLKIGMGEKTIFDQLHPDAMEVFNTCSDVKRVCWKLYDPHERIVREDWTITPGRVFIPMLAWRSKQLGDVMKAMKKGRPRRDPEHQWREGEYRDDEFIMEEKLDGERIQLHKIGDSYQYHSRKTKEYTYLYGSHESVGSLTPFLQDVFVDEVEEIVLDGEMLVWDPSRKKYMAFGNLKTFANMRAENIGPHDPRPCFKVFDILYLKGVNGKGTPLLEKALWDRKKLLQRVLKPKVGVIEIADYVTGKSIDDIRGFLTRILEERGEGLVVKHPLSMYSLNARLDAWIKIKPEYMDSLGENIDAVIIGGYWGAGKKTSGILASYMIGLRGKINGRPVVHSFAKVGTGLSRMQYDWIEEHYQAKWSTYDRKNPPAWFHTVNEWPDVLIEPEKSFVIEVKAAEIVGGVDYGAGMTLRFPRAKRILDNRDWDDSMDLETVRSFRTGPQKRTMSGEFSSKAKVMRTNTSKKAHSVSAAVGDVEVNGHVFDNLTFYIHTTTPATLKTELQKTVVENGGTIIQAIPPPDVERVVVAQKFAGIKNRKGAKDVDIVNPAWVTDSIEKGRRMPMHERYLVNATDATRASPDYLGADAMAIMVDSDDEEPAASAEELASASPALTYREPRPDYGEEAEDSEDDPETEVEDDWEPTESLTADFARAAVSSDEEEDESQGTVAKGVGDLELGAVKGDLAKSQGSVNDDRLSQAVPTTVKAEEEQLEDCKDLGPLPFSRFVAYFDTQANAASNALPASTKSPAVQKQADQELLAAKEIFIEKGGFATDDLADDMLTHLVVSELVPERYKDLINRTSQPAYRRIVTSDWISHCAENGLVDEDDFKPAGAAGAVDWP